MRRSSLRVPVSVVFGSRIRAKVRGIAASPIVATMKNIQRPWVFPSGKPIGEPVGANGSALSVESELSVSVLFVETADPWPAFVGSPLVHVGPKAVCLFLGDYLRKRFGVIIVQGVSISFQIGTA